MEWENLPFNIVTGSEPNSGKRKRGKKPKWTDESKSWKRVGSKVEREKRKPGRKRKRMTERELRILRQEDAQSEWKIRWGMKNLSLEDEELIEQTAQLKNIIEKPEQLIEQAVQLENLAEQPEPFIEQAVQLEQQDETPIL